MTVVGYDFVRQLLALPVFPVDCPAVVRPVTRMQRLAGELAVPAQIAPRGDDVVDHLLFALKHEGTELQIIAAACTHIPPWRLLDALRDTPTGGYLRKLCYLWEHFTQRELSGLPSGVGGIAVPLFDPAKAGVTKAGVRSCLCHPPLLARISTRHRHRIAGASLAHRWGHALSFARVKAPVSSCAGTPPASSRQWAVGTQVSLFKPGDRVWYAGDITRAGCNAELHCVDERIAGPMSQSLSFAQAAAMPLPLSR